MTQRPREAGNDAPGGMMLFVKASTGEVIPTPEADLDGGRAWAVENAGRLGISPPKRFDRFDIGHRKLLDNALSSAGWSFVSAFRHFRYGNYMIIGPVGMNDLHEVVAIAMRQGAPRPDCLSARTSEADHIEFEGETVDTLLGGGGIDPEVLAEKFTRNGDIDFIVDELRTLPFADRIKVFGSVARGKPFPGDLDIWVDLRDEPFDPTKVERLLSLAGTYYGAFDPFVATDTEILCRSETARSWVRARGARLMERQAAREGIALCDVPSLLAEPPGEAPLPMS